MTLAVGLAALAVHDSAMAYWRARAVEAVPAMADTDPAIRLARLRLAGPSGSTQPAVVAAAQAVLQQSPLDAAALTDLGVALLSAKRERASNIVELAEKVSRRNLTTQFTLLELAVQAGDVPAALRHYDRAMLVHPETVEVLGPILARGLAEPQIRREVASYGASLWFRQFALSALDNGADATAIAVMLGEAYPRIPAERRLSIINLVTDRLVNIGQPAAVRTLLAGLPPKLSASARRLTLPSTDSAGIQSLDWWLAEDATVQAAIAPGQGLEIQVAPEARGTVGTRRTVLDPGTYRLETDVAAEPGTARPELTWSVGCIGTAGAAPTLVRLGSGSAREARQAYSVVIPPQCKLQGWTLAVAGGIGQMPSRVVLSRLELKRTGG